MGCSIGCEACVRAVVECRPAAGRRICERCHQRKAKCSLAGTVSAGPLAPNTFMTAMTNHAAVLERHSVMLERYLDHEEAKLGLQVPRRATGDKASTSEEASTVRDPLDDDESVDDEEEEKGGVVKVKFADSREKDSGDDDDDDDEEDEKEEEE